ncbi:MAG TPA: ribonuclease J [Anaerolinea thermolimosa]|uniref:Ribonuclease J n=1 Tax=Anaerolinea thermolimosa TaxID=229919 RepID=A0A3D1JDZ7_9CHLR|nr:ribonuclease J [Anaerolinea thermolimosa]
MSSKPLRIIPLGGLGEVGRNMMVYEYNDEILVVDAGLMFPENDMLGIDYIIPDLTYLSQNRSKVRGIVITHGHEDHIGAIHHLLNEVNAPIYATPLTRGLLEVKLGRNGLGSKADLHTVQAGDTVSIGPFEVEFFHVCHSIPDGVGLGIHTPAGLIVHSGDYKFDHTPVDGKPSDYARLASFSQKGVLALLADSTNAERPGWTPSEKTIDAAFEDVFTNASGRIILASFASLISRMQQVANAASKHKRKLAFVGTSMIDNMKMAVKLGYLDFPENLVVPIEQALNMPREQVVIMCTGSQGEPTSILGRLSMGTNRLFDIIPGDTVVLSSHPIPGNEESVYRVINRLFQLGANVIYEAIAPVHVSGHASQEEMKLLIHLTRPRYVLPIHGELRQLYQHARLARQVGIPEENIQIIQNGQVVEFLDGKMRLTGEQVPAQYVFVDGSGVGDVDPDVMREREALSRDGIVLVNLTLTRDFNAVVYEPEIITKGFILSRESDELLASARREIIQAASRANGNVRRVVEDTLREFLYKETRRRPMVFVNISRSI